MLWTDLFTPTSLDASIPFNKSLYTSLHTLFQNKQFVQDVPHLLISGAKGIGKITLVRLIIQTIHKTIMSPLAITSCPGPSIGLPADVEIQYAHSNVHEEFVPENCPSNHQDALIQHFVKSRVATRHIKASGFFKKKQTLTPDSLSQSYKIVVLHRIDEWSLAAQHALRRIMEQSNNHIRFIFTTSKPSRVIAPLQSRCGPILRLVTPTPSQLTTWLVETVLPTMNYYETQTPWISNPSLLQEPRVLQCISDLVRRQQCNIRHCLLYVQEWFIHFQSTQQLSQASVWLYPSYSWIYKWTLWLKHVIAQWKLVYNQNTKVTFPLPQAQFMDQCHHHIVTLIKSDQVSLEDLCIQFNYIMWCYIIHVSGTAPVTLSGASSISAPGTLSVTHYWRRLKAFHMYSFKSENIQCIPTLQHFMFDILSLVFGKNSKKNDEWKELNHPTIKPNDFPCGNGSEKMIL